MSKDETTLVPPPSLTAPAVDDAVRRIQSSWRRSKGTWVAAIVAVLLLAEQGAVAGSFLGNALPTLAAKFQTDQIVWVFTIWILAGSVIVPIVSKIGDRFGKRRALLLSGLLAIAGYLISGFAGSFEIMLVGRAVSGVSTALAFLCFGLIRDVFPPNMRSLALGLATNGAGIIGVAGPFIAAWILSSSVGVDGLFYFLAAITVLGQLGIYFFVPESANRSKSGLDLPGAVLLGGGVLGILYAISKYPTDGADVSVVSSFFGGLALLAGWWVWESRVKEPMIDPAALKSRPIPLTMLAVGCVLAATTMNTIFLPTFLMTPTEAGLGYGFGVTPSGVALYMIAPGIAAICGGVIVAVLAKRVGYRAFVIAGPIFASIGSLGLGLFHTEPWQVVVFGGILGLGTMAYAAGVGLVLELAPIDQRGIAVGVLGTVVSIFSALGPTIGSSLLNSHVAVIANGYPVYSDGGVMAVYLASAAICVCGLIAAVLVPRSRSSFEVAA